MEKEYINEFVPGAIDSANLDNLAVKMLSVQAKIDTYLDMKNMPDVPQAEV